MTALLFLKAAWTWLKGASAWQLIALGLLFLLAIQTFRIDGLSVKLPLLPRVGIVGLIDQRDAYKKQRDQIIAASKDAEKRNKTEVQKREAESQRISDNAKSNYQSDLARLRADYERRLRAQAKGSAGQPGLSKDGPTPQGTDGTDQLPLPSEELLRAQEIELQLMHLQNWVRDQLAAQ